MAFPPRLPRLDRLTPGDWLLAGEALASLVWASLAIALLPFRKVAGVASQAPVRPIASLDAGLPRRIRWAVDAWGRRVPWRAVCFQRGLAAHRMLRRRGYGSILHYGVAQQETKGLSAHVWVSLDGRPVIGGEEASGFTCLATFPEQRSDPCPTD
jgi:hypothetical protein